MRFLTEWSSQTSIWYPIVGGVVGLLLSLIGQWFWNDIRGVRLAVFILTIGFLGYILSTFVAAPNVAEGQFIGTLILWGVFVYLCSFEALKLGLGKRLSIRAKKQGEPPNRWVRQIEYPCIFFSIVGLIVTVNRLPAITAPLGNLDLYGPVILMTAASLKFLKTRAEVNEWHNPEKLKSARF
jgi:vacuolar-type H+-ATPase subunit I/STV1